MDSNSNSHPIFSGDTSSDPLFSNFTLQSLLTFNNSSTFFSDNNSPPLPNLPESISDQTHHPNINNNNTNLFLVRKTEHPLTLNLPPLQDFLPNIQQPFNFFPQSFHRLPQLISPELPPSNTKRLRHSFTLQTTTPPPPPPQQPHRVPQSTLARQRRQTLSEKTRCLQKLMPWDKKMDQATLYEEAYKYVKFLQAQYSVLQSMPFHSPTNNNVGGNGNNGVFGDLEKLNRNQALQCLVNSPVAQTKLCSQGYCVFSMEQFSLLRKLTERRQHQHQQQQQQQQQQNLSEHGSSKTIFY